MEGKIDYWIKLIKTLSEIAASEPHCALAAYIYRLRNKCVCFMRKIPKIIGKFKPLEKKINKNFCKKFWRGLDVIVRQSSHITATKRWGNRCWKPKEVL